MNPFHAAASVESVAGFTNDLAAHLEPGGYVLSHPDFFLMFRPVPVDAPIDDLLNPWRRWPAADCDCWLVWLAAGNLAMAADALIALAGPQKWLAFQRDGPPHFWRFTSTISWLKARAAAQTAKQSTSSAKA